MTGNRNTVAQAKPTSVNFTIRVPEPLLDEFKALASREWDRPGPRLVRLMAEDVKQNGDKA